MDYPDDFEPKNKKRAERFYQKMKAIERAKRLYKKKFGWMDNIYGPDEYESIIEKRTKNGKIKF